MNDPLHHTPLIITPLIITPGDPAGIGPEIALKALANDSYLSAHTVLIGDRAHLGKLAQTLGLSVAFQKWTPGSPLYEDVINLAEISWPAPVIAGKPDSANAPLVIQSIEIAAQLALQGDVKAIITCPIAKANLYEAGFTYPGHTEFLGALSGGKTPLMMLANKTLRVVPATIHIPIARVSNALTQEGLSSLIQGVTQALQHDFGLSQPRIAICGLNPHAGENGAMGDEEITTIAPAIAGAQQTLGKSAVIEGPVAADSLFHSDKITHYDCVIGMYHDQVLIPVKTIDFHGTVNITLGLDFIRTSPDHGTAFDIAGRNLARPDSLINALMLAEQMANHRVTSQNVK